MKFEAYDFSTLGVMQDSGSLLHPLNKVAGTFGDLSEGTTNHTIA